MLAIISLAVIGGLASFCFTKVVGIVFLGEPRTAMARQASRGRLGNDWYQWSFLAVLCLVIGHFSHPFIELAFGGLADMSLFLVRIDHCPGKTIGTNLALGSRLFLATFLVYGSLPKAPVSGARKLLPDQPGAVVLPDHHANAVYRYLVCPQCCRFFPPLCLDQERLMFA